MTYAPYKGATLLIPYGEKPHLFIVLNDPCREGACLLTMITTMYNNKKHDPACVFNGGEHPFIKHPSYALYRLANISQASHIANMVNRKYYQTNEDVSAGMYDVIINGLHNSEHTPHRIIKYFNSL